MGSRLDELPKEMLLYWQQWKPRQPFLAEDRIQFAD